MNFKSIAKIHNESFSKKHDEKFFESLEYITYLLDNRAYLILIDSIDVYEIFEIAVEKEYRGKGLAKKLLNMLPDTKPIMLEVNVKNLPAISLYKKMGFKQISLRKNYYNTDDAIIMRR